MSTRRATAIDLDADLAAAPPGVRTRVMLFRRLLALGGQLRGRMDERLRRVGLTTQQAAVLTIAGAIRPAPGPGEVARMLGVSHQNVRQLTDALAAKGLLEVRAHPADRRAKQFVPTRRAAPVFARRNDEDFAAVAGWLGPLREGEARTMLALTSRLLAAFAADASTMDAATAAPPAAARRARRAAPRPGRSGARRTRR